MTDNLDKYIDSKLKKSELTRTTDNFTRLLMDKIRTDYAIETELRKSGRAANYIIGFFASLMGIITIIVGYFLVRSAPETENYFYLYIHPFQRYKFSLPPSRLQRQSKGLKPFRNSN